MPLYGYRCDTCGLEFEVSRPLARAAEPAFCPVDNTTCERVEVTPGTFVRQGEHREGDIPRPRQRAAYSHFGHSHGPGAGAHSH